MWEDIHGRRNSMAKAESVGRTEHLQIRDQFGQSGREKTEISPYRCFHDHHFLMSLVPAQMSLSQSGLSNAQSHGPSCVLTCSIHVKCSAPKSWSTDLLCLSFWTVRTTRTGDLLSFHISDGQCQRRGVLVISVETVTGRGRTEREAGAAA